jgi:plasmid stabilization system protein ParE
MKRPVRLVPEARAEFDKSADWYEKKQLGLGVDFVSKVREVLERIAVNPRLHTKMYGDVRKAVVRRFPFIVLYVEDPDEVVVIAVFHTSGDPAIWQARI